MKKRIYLDHAATTPLDKRVLKEMMPYFGNKFGNASSLHSFGQEAKIDLEKARERVAKLINAEPEEIIFTSGGSESDNLALRGIAYANREKGNHIIASSIEHPAILRTVEGLENEGFRISIMPVGKDGFVDPEKIRAEINEKTILVSVMHANNEIGTIQPIEEIAKICSEKNVYFHSDAVQSFGKVKIDVKKVPVSMMSFSAHKIYGPKGIGALYVRKGTRIKPIITGGPQERKMRAGTENVASAVGFAKAAELMHAEMDKENKRLIGIRDYLIKELLKISDSRLNGGPEKRLPNNVSIIFKYVEGESLLTMLDMEGIAVSTGSACSSASLKPSHVLLAIGCRAEEAHGSLRISLGRANTMEDAEFAVKKVPEIVAQLRRFSPLGKKDF